MKRADPRLPLYLETKGKLTGSGVVDDLVSLYVFEKEGAFQSVAHALKYSGTQSLGLELGKQLGRLLLERNIVADALVPIPLHRRKFRERGYNQSELLARGIEEATGIRLDSRVVRRKKFTQTQTTLSLEDRRKNVDDAFECPDSVSQYKSIIIIDDVITTGSTMICCARVLKAAGARRIIGASTAIAE